MKKEQEDFKSRLPHIPKKKSGLEEKDVEIIQSKKTREIRIMPVVDRKLLEEAGQETIIFNSENIPPREQLLSLSVTEEEQKQEYSVRVPDKLAVEPIAEIFGGELELDIIPEQAIDADIIKIKTENAVGLAEKNALLEEENIQHPKRWKVWKEKISGFIKKLFG
jgi:hypothetical protein